MKDEDPVIPSEAAQGAAQPRDLIVLSAPVRDAAPPRDADPVDNAAMTRVARSAVARAVTGDMRAAEIAYWTWRSRRQTVRLDLPPMTDAAGIAAGQAEVIRLVAGEQLTPREGRDVATILEYRRRAIEMEDVERILNDVQEANRKREQDAREAPMNRSTARKARRLAQAMLPEPEPDMTGWTNMERFIWEEKQIGLHEMHRRREEARYAPPTPEEVWAAENARDEAILAARAADAAAEQLARYPGSAAAQINARATREAAERLAKIAEEAERVAEEAKLRPPPPDDEPVADAEVAEEAARLAAVDELPPSPAAPEPAPSPEPKPEPQWWEEKAQWRERGPADHYEDAAVYECEHEYDPLADDDDDREEVVEY